MKKYLVWCSQDGNKEHVGTYEDKEQADSVVNKLSANKKYSSIRHWVEEEEEYRQYIGIRDNMMPLIDKAF